MEILTRIAARVNRDAAAAQLGSNFAAKQQVLPGTTAGNGLNRVNGMPSLGTPAEADGTTTFINNGRPAVANWQPSNAASTVNTNSANGVVVGGSGTMLAHSLDGPYHIGPLNSNQAPQFLLIDGTRALIGNLAVGAGITIDGIDLSAHAADPNAHHNRSHSVIGTSDHTITGAKYALVGATATDTIGLLTPIASSIGPLEGILKSDSAGALELVKLRTQTIDTGTSQNLTIQPGGDLSLAPVSNKVTLASAKRIETAGFASGWLGTGARMFFNDVNTKGELEADNLWVRGSMHVYELIIQQIRATNGSIVVSSSAKIASATLISGASYKLVVDASTNDYQPFAIGDVLRAQRVQLQSATGQGSTIWQSDLVVTDINVSNGDDTQRTFAATLQTGTTVPASGMEFVRLGNANVVARQGLLYLTSDDSLAPYMDVATGITSHALFNTPGVIKARIGKLDGLTGGTNEYGIIAGNSTWTEAGVWFKASNVAVELHNVPLKLYSSASGSSKQTVNIDSTGVDIWFGTSAGGSSDKRLTWDGATLAVNGAITAQSGSIAGLLTIGANGELRQGTGTFGSNFTGLRIWHDTNIGRIGGYKTDVVQWSATTDGRLSAGAGQVILDAAGVHLGTYPNLVTTAPVPNEARAISFWTDPTVQTGSPLARMYVADADEAGGSPYWQVIVEPGGTRPMSLSLWKYTNRALWATNIESMAGFPGFNSSHVYGGTALFNITGNLLMTGTITAENHVLPNPTLTYDLGTALKRWRTFYARDIDITGTITGGTLSGSTWSHAGVMSIAATTAEATTLNIANAGTGVTSLYVQGDITLGGTVDGVDVASLGSGYTSHTGNSDIHVAHSGVTLTAGDGLTGGGTIAASRTFTVGVANTGAVGLSVEENAVRLTSKSDGSADAHILATDANGYTSVVQLTAPAIYGSSAANGDLTLEGTSHATKTSSYVLLQPNGGNVGIGVASPSYPLDVSGYGRFSSGAIFANGKTWDIGGSTNDLFVNETGIGTRMAFKAGGRIGVNTSDPSVLFDVAGSARVRDVLRAGDWRHVLSTSFSSQGVNGYLLSTSIPYDGATSRGMHAVRVTGYAYAHAAAIDFVVNFYCYSSGNFAYCSWTNFGSFYPGTIKLSFAGGLVKIWWSTLVYFPSFEVFASTHAGYGLPDSDFEGWTITDAVAPVTNVITVPGMPNVLNGLTMTGNIALNGNWLSGDGTTEGIYVDSTGKVGVQKSNPTYTLDVTGDIRATGNVYVDGSTLDVDATATIRDDLTVGPGTPAPGVLFVDVSQKNVGINRAPDNQFALDVSGPLRADYLVGQVAIQLESAVGVFHFDGPTPYNTNFSGFNASHMGAGGTETGGIIYRPGKFQKAVQVAEATTNLVLNPSFEHATWTTYWSVNVTNFTNTCVDFGLYGAKAIKCIKTANNSDNWTLYSSHTLAAGTYTASCWVWIPSSASMDYPYISDQNFTNATIAGDMSKRDQWQRIVLTFTTGGGTGLIVLRCHNMTAGSYIYTDAWQLEAKAYATPYCDGSLGQGHTWDVPASPHASTSSRSLSSLKYSPSATFLNAQTGIGTVMAWIYLDAINPGDSHAIVSDWSGYDYLGFFVTGNKGLYATWGSNNVGAVAATNTVTLGEWTHVCMTCDGTTIRIYCNGIEVASGSSGSHTGGGTYLGVGMDTWQGGFVLNGLIDDLVFLDYAAEADLVLTIYESDAPVFVESSVFAFRSPSRVPIWVDNEGLWARGVSGGDILGVYGGNPDWVTGDPAAENEKSWGGVTLQENDILFGRSTQAYMHWDDSAGQIILGRKGYEHILLSSSGMQVKYDTTVYTSLAAGTLILGSVAEENLQLTSSGIDFRNATEVQGSLSGTAWTLGKTGTSQNNVYITPSAIQLRSATDVLAELAGSTLTLGQLATNYVKVTASSIEIGRNSVAKILLDVNGNAEFTGKVTASSGSITGTLTMGPNGKIDMTTVDLDNDGIRIQTAEAYHEDNAYSFYTSTTPIGGLYAYNDGSLMYVSQNANINESGTAAIAGVNVYGDMRAASKGDTKTANIYLAATGEKTDGTQGRSATFWLMARPLSAGATLANLIADTFNVVANTIITGTLETSSTITAAGHVLPKDTNTYDLGSSSNKWRNLYISGAVSGDTLGGQTWTYPGGMTIDAVTASAVTTVSIINSGSGGTANLSVEGAIIAGGSVVMDLGKTLRQGYGNKRAIALPIPANDAGPGKWYIRLHPSTTVNLASVRVTAQGSYNYAAIMGWLTAEYSYYSPGNSTILYNDFRATSTTGYAWNNLRLGDLVVENGYISIPVWCVNTNSPHVIVEWWDTGTIDANLTNSAWMSEAMPAANYQSIQSNLHVSGNVGIGTASPNAPLHIQGTGNHIKLSQGGLTDRFIGIGTDDLFYLSNWTDTTKGMVITAGGNVGIGNTSPSQKLDVAGAIRGTANSMFYIPGYDTPSNIGVLTVQGNLNAFGLTSQSYASQNKWALRLRDVVEGDFSIYDVVNSAARLYIDNLGRIGIGKSNPTYTLDVSGDIRATGDLYVDGGMVDFGTNYIEEGVSNLEFQGSKPFAFRQPIYEVSTFTDVSGSGVDVTVFTNINTTGTYYNLSQSLHLDGVTIAEGITNSGYLMGQHIGVLRYYPNDKGTLASLYGQRIQFGHYTGAATARTTGNVYGILIDPYYMNGTISNMYGLYIAAGVGGATIGELWGVFQEGTAFKNYFAGKTGIGVSPADTRLHVSSMSSSDNALVQRWSYNTADSAFYLDLKQTVTSNVVRWNFSQVNNTTAYNDVLVLDRGNVGIGTASPAEKLAVFGNVNIGNNDATNPVNYLRFGATQYGAADIRPTDEGTHTVGLAFYTDATADATINPIEKVRITSTGNVGIGTSSPGALLELSKTYNPRLRLTESYDSNSWDIITGITDRNQFAILQVTPGAYRFFIDSIGRTGIGGTDPAAKLVVYGTSVASVEKTLFLENRYSATNTWAIGTALQFGYYSGYDNYSSRIVGYTNPASTYGTRLQLQSHSTADGVFNTGVFINEYGKVGINTTNPESKLHTMGEGGFAPSLTHFAVANVEFSASTAGVGLAMGQDTSSPYGWWLQTRHTYSDGYAYPILLNPLGGNVGIGNTSPSYALDVSGDIRTGGYLLFPSAPSQTWTAPVIFRNGFYIAISDYSGVQLGGYNGTAYGPRLTVTGGGRVGINTESPAQDLHIYSTGNAVAQIDGAAASTTGLLFAQAGSEVGRIVFSANQDMTFTTGTNVERLKIKSTGNVGINSTSPSYTLDVNGDIRATGDIFANSDLTVYDNLTVTNGDLKVGTNKPGITPAVLYVNAAGTRVGINCAPDSQFDLDVAGPIRGTYLVGQHAIQLSNAVGVFHFDGPQPYNLLNTGSNASHMGVGGTETGGVIYRPGKFGKAVQVAESTTNLVLNPSFEVDTTGWGWQDGLDGSWQRSSAFSMYGGYSLECTVASAGGVNGQYALNTTNDLGDIGGQTVTVSAWVKPHTHGCGFSVYWQDSGQNWIWDNIQSVFSTGSDWQRLMLTVVAPSGTHRVTIVPSPSSYGTGKFYLDAVQIEIKAYATPYCDGSLGNGHTWDSVTPGDGLGTPHASKSGRTDATLSYPTPMVGNIGTVMFWFKTSKRADLRPAEEYDMLFECNYGYGGPVIGTYYGPSSSYFAFWGLGDSTHTYATPEAERWYFAAITWDSTTVTTWFGDDAGVITSQTTTQTAGRTFGADTLYVGSWNGSWFGNSLIDELVLVDSAIDADLVRAIYESDAPVFVESSVFHWRSPGKVPIWVDEYGLWAKGVSGDAILGVYGGDPRGVEPYKSWGSVNLYENDILIGRADKSYFMWDDSAGKILLGRENYEHILFSSTAIQFKDGSTIWAELSNEEFTIGEDTSTHVLIDSSAIKFKNDTTVFASMGSGDIRMGRTDQNHTLINYTSFQVKTGTDVYTDLTAGALTLGLVSGGEYIKVDGTDGLSIYGGGVLRGQWSANGGITIGTYASGKSRIRIDAGGDISFISRYTFEGSDYDTTNIALYANGDAYFSGQIEAQSGSFEGVVSIGASGELRQGSGTLGSDFTGLRVWRDSSIGRIAGYNNNVIQWGAGTDGKLKAGSVIIDAAGIQNTIPAALDSDKGYTFIDDGVKVAGVHAAYSASETLLTISVNADIEASQWTAIDNSRDSRVTVQSIAYGTGYQARVYLDARNTYTSKAAAISVEAKDSSTIIIAADSVVLQTSNIQAQGVITIDEMSVTPTNLTAYTQANIYMKDDKLIIQYKYGSTTYYKYIDLVGTSGTWVHTTTAP